MRIARIFVNHSPVFYRVRPQPAARENMVDVIILNFMYGFTTNIAISNFHFNLHLAHLLEIRFAYIHQNNPTIPVLHAATITAKTNPHKSQYTLQFAVARVISHFQNLYLQLVCCSAIEYPFGYACNLSFNIGNARLTLYNR